MRIKELLGCLLFTISMLYGSVSADINDEIGIRVDATVINLSCRDGMNHPMACPTLPVQIGSSAIYRYTYDTSAEPEMDGTFTSYQAQREAYIKVGDYEHTFSRSILTPRTVSEGTAIRMRNDFQYGNGDRYASDINVEGLNVPGIAGLDLQFLALEINDFDALMLDNVLLPKSPVDLSKASDPDFKVFFFDNNVTQAGELRFVEVISMVDTMEFSEVTFRASGTVMDVLDDYDGSDASFPPVTTGEPWSMRYTFDSATQGTPITNNAGFHGFNYWNMREIILNFGSQTARIDRETIAHLTEETAIAIGVRNDFSSNNIGPFYDRYDVNLNMTDGLVPVLPKISNQELGSISFEYIGDSTAITDHSLLLDPPDLSKVVYLYMDAWFNPNNAPSQLQARLITDAFVKVGLPETPMGENVLVDPLTVDENGNSVNITPVSLTFDNVTGAGETTVTLTQNSPPVPPTLKLGEPAVYYDLQSTATFIDSVGICIDYRDLTFDDETTLAMLHFTDPDGAGPQLEQWVDVTTLLDNDNDIICGSTTSFSPFAIVEENVITGSGTIGNFIWNDINHNGIQNVGEPGLEDVVVTLEDCGGHELTSVVSDASGHYSFENLMIGSYRVKFNAPDGYAFSPRRVGNKGGKDSDANVTTGLTYCLSMSDDQTRLGIDAGLMMQSQTSSIGDFVWHDSNKNGIKNAGEAGAGGVTVRLQDCNGNNIKTKTTQTNGKYLFDNLPAGRYRVKFVAPQGTSFSPAMKGKRRGRDSDPRPATGLTSCRFVPAGVARLGIDAGLVN